MHHLPYLLPYIASLMLSIGIAVYAWRHRQVEGVFPFCLMAVSQALWIFGYILELSVSSMSAKVFWDDFQYLGLLPLPFVTTLFALQYARVRMKHLRLAWQLAAAFVGIALLMVATNHWHRLVRYHEVLEPGQPFDTLTYDFTAFLWLSVLITLTGAITATVILVRLARRSRGLYRTQAAVMALGIFSPMVALILFGAGIQIAGQRDVTPITFALGNLIVAWALFRYRIFELVPVARDAVLESMDDAVIVLDTEARLIDWNPAARHLFNGTGKMGEPIAKTFSNWKTLLSAYQSRGSATRLDVASENGEQHFELNISPVRDSQAALRGYLLVLRNITDRVKARQAIQQQSEELQRKNSELEVAWEAAKEADRIKSQFLASMSHELRTPLNAILNFTEFVALGMLGPVTPQQVDALEKTLSSGKHLLGLINDVLDVTKLESGMMNLFVEANINLQSELATVTASAETLLKDKPVRFIKDFDADLPPIVGDKRRIRQILLNLLSNACKFTETGTITFAVKRQKDHLLFMVSDTGPGIAPEDQELIFEPFKQTEVGISHAGGTGLGLPISKRLVEAHEGKIWLESIPGEGTSFFVTLPFNSPTLVEKIRVPEKPVHA